MSAKSQQQKKRFGSERHGTLELQRRVRGDISQTKLSTDIYRERRRRGSVHLTSVIVLAGFRFAAIFLPALGLVLIAAEIVEQRGTDAVYLAVERTCVCQILDLAKHFHA